MESYSSCVFLCLAFLLSIMFSSFFHFMVWITSFLFIVKWYHIGWMYYILFIYSPVDGHLYCFLSRNYEWCCYEQKISVQVFVRTSLSLLTYRYLLFHILSQYFVEDTRWSILLRFLWLEVCWSHLCCVLYYVLL